MTASPLDHAGMPRRRFGRSSLSTVLRLYGTVTPIDLTTATVRTPINVGRYPTAIATSWQSSGQSRMPSTP